MLKLSLSFVFLSLFAMSNLTEALPFEASSNVTDDATPRGRSLGEYIFNGLFNIFTQSLSNRWQKSENGTVLWQSDCDFPADTSSNSTAPVTDLATIPSGKAEDCAGICIENPSCNHFTHRRGECVTKKGFRLSVRDETGADSGYVCGFLPERTFDPED